MLIAHASGRWVTARTTSAREANAELTARIQELLAGFRVLRCFGRGAAATGEVERFSQAFAGRNLSAMRLRLGLRPLYSTLMMSGVLVVIWQGGERVIDGAMSVGAFVAYLGLFIRFVERGFRIPQLVNSIQSGGAAYARLAPLLAPALGVAREPRFASFKPNHIPGVDDEALPRKRGCSGPVAVSLRNLTFTYPGATRPVLIDLSLDIPAGSLIALTGPVGSGKSALSRVLLGIYPVGSGTVRLCASDGSLADYDSSVVGYLPQDAQLFSGSIRENVLMTNESGHLGCAAAALALAALDADIAQFPRGADTQIGELGVRISGGQRQRVALARAIAACAPGRPGLLVLDDPFSAVDVETEMRIVAALRDAFGPEQPENKRATILLCSQRLAAFPRADRVVVLENGRIEEQGTHGELLRREGLYARIFRAQTRSGLAAAECEA
jgi:ABC-type multidrug transport system fused ATPase/permease subunit